MRLSWRLYGATGACSAEGVYRVFHRNFRTIDSSTIETLQAHVVKLLALTFASQPPPPPTTTKAICYNYAMAACGRSGNDGQAEWLLREMRLQGVTPNRISYSAAMFALGKAGRLRDVSSPEASRSARWETPAKTDHVSEYHHVVCTPYTLHFFAVHARPAPADCGGTHGGFALARV